MKRLYFFQFHIFSNFAAFALFTSARWVQLLRYFHSDRNKFFIESWEKIDVFFSDVNWLLFCLYLKCVQSFPSIKNLRFQDFFCDFLLSVNFDWKNHYFFFCEFFKWFYFSQFLMWRDDTMRSLNLFKIKKKEFLVT